MKASQSSKKNFCMALTFGFFVGIIDSFHVAHAGPGWRYLGIIAAITFWTTLSLVISTSSFGGQPGITKGIVWSAILNISWATHFSDIGMVDILPLFFLGALGYGADIRWLNRKFNLIA